MKGIFAILTAMLATLLIMVGSLFLGVDQTDVTKVQGKTPEYHIQIITQNTDEHFWTLFQEGAQAAATDMNVYVEFVPIAPRNADALVDTVKKAIYSRVDGIAMQPADFEKTKKVTQDAINAGIAIVNYENDKYLISEVPEVGSNSYDVGYTAGAMVQPAVGSAEAKVAVILDEGNSQGDSQYKNMKVQGILDAISIYGKINLEDVYTLDAGMFEAERLTSSIIKKKNINVIICTDEKSTPAVAQVLVDSNKVGDIKIIGYGTMSQTLDYIKRGVIYGTVSPDAYGIGYQTVKQVYGSLKGEAVSDSNYTDLFTIDDSNIDKYIAENADETN